MQEKKAVAESSVLVQEAARLADQGKKEEAKELLGNAVKGLSAAPASPAVRAEMDHANRYKDRIDEMEDVITSYSIHYTKLYEADPAVVFRKEMERTFGSGR